MVMLGLFGARVGTRREGKWSFLLTRTKSHLVSNCTVYFPAPRLPAIRAHEPALDYRAGVTT
eukprot:5323627-Amphidinium_carterae.1